VRGIKSGLDNVTLEGDISKWCPASFNREKKSPDKGQRGGGDQIDICEFDREEEGENIGEVVEA